MVRFQSFILFSIFIALPNGTSTSELDGGATSSSSRRQDDDDGRRHRPASTMTTTTTTVRILDELYMKVKNTIDATNSSDISSSTPTTATNSTTSAPGAVNPPPTPITTPAPTPSSPTFPPTKKYEPDDEEKKEEEKEQQQKKGQPSIGMIFLWTIVTFALLWMSCYFSDAIIFFFGNVSFSIGPAQTTNLFCSGFYCSC